MTQNLLKGLCLTLRDFLGKWEKTNVEGMKTLEAITNHLTELQY